MSSHPISYEEYFSSNNSEEVSDLGDPDFWKCSQVFIGQ